MSGYRTANGLGGIRVTKLETAGKGKPRRIGIEPENDLAAALLYERRQPIREVS